MGDGDRMAMLPFVLFECVLVGWVIIGWGQGSLVGMFDYVHWRM